MAEDPEKMATKISAGDDPIVQKKANLQLLLECRQYELEICRPGTRMHQVIQKDIRYLEKRISEVSVGSRVFK
jgi:nucleosome binding factor SPN SPT16 subunit